MKKIGSFYVDSSIHVGISVYALLLITELYCELPTNWLLNNFIFFGTISGYNFVKYAGIAKMEHKRLTKSLKLLQVFSFFCFLLMLFYASQLPFKTLLLFVPLCLLTVFYAVPFIGSTKSNLRSIPSIKILIISLVWSAVTVLLPLLDFGYHIEAKIVLLFLQRFLFVVALTLPFDIRDFKFDKKQLQTIPQIIGVERTKKLGFILLLLIALIEFFITPNRSFKFVFLIVFLLLLIFIQRASTKQSKYYASFWVEATPVFWWLLILGVS